MQKENESAPKKGFFARRAESAAGAAKKLVAYEQIAETASWIREGASVIDPRRFPLSKREEWMNPEKNRFTFEGVMLRNGVTEDEVERRHKALALSAYVCIVGVGLVAGLTVSALLDPSIGTLGQIMAGTGMSAVLLSAATRFSFQSMQLRERNLNLHLVRDWLPRRGQWIPPYSR